MFWALQRLGRRELPDSRRDSGFTALPSSGSLKLLGAADKVTTGLEIYTLARVIQGCSFAFRQLRHHRHCRLSTSQSSGYLSQIQPLRPFGHLGWAHRRLARFRTDLQILAIRPPQFCMPRIVNI